MTKAEKTLLNFVALMVVKLLAKDIDDILIKDSFRRTTSQKGKEAAENLSQLVEFAGEVSPALRNSALKIIQNNTQTAQMFHKLSKDRP